MSTPIDLTLLPAPTVVEVIDYETIYARRKARMIALYPADEQAEIAATLELESEPLARLLQENTYTEMVLRHIPGVHKFSPAEYALMGYPSGRFDLHVVNILGFFVQDVTNKADVTGVLVSTAGELNPGGPTVGPAAGFLKKIQLVR